MGRMMEPKTYNLKYFAAHKNDEKHFVPAYAVNRPACKAILNGQHYEPKTHEFISYIASVDSGELVHAGTFFGDMLPSFCNSFKGSYVYCFEPVIENYILARLTVAANRLANCLLYNAALSSCVGNKLINTLDESGAHLGGASSIGSRGQIVPSLTINSFDFKNLLVIQLDIEGHELDALRGAVSTIKKHEPIILVEDNLKNCTDFLLGVGYARYLDIPGLQIWASKKWCDIVQKFQ